MQTIPFITTNHRGETTVTEAGVTTAFRTVEDAQAYVFDTRGYDRVHVEAGTEF